MHPIFKPCFFSIEFTKFEASYIEFGVPASNHVNPLPNFTIFNNSFLR